MVIDPFDQTVVWFVKRDTFTDMWWHSNVLKNCFSKRHNFDLCDIWSEQRKICYHFSTPENQYIGCHFTPLVDLCLWWHYQPFRRWRYVMETVYAGNPPVTNGFSSQGTSNAAFLTFSLMLASTNYLTKSWFAGDLRHHDAYVAWL